MPYSAQHKRDTRARIVECARILFNRHGFEGVTIDMVMEDAGLTRGGFYNHFRGKEELFAAAVSSFLMGRGSQWRADVGVDPNRPDQAASQMLAGYLSPEHLDDVDGQCPMIALPSDVARGSADVQKAYQQLLEGMVSVFARSIRGAKRDRERTALVLAALSVGGMVIARTLPDSHLAERVRKTAFEHGRVVLKER